MRNIPFNNALFLFKIVFTHSYTKTFNSFTCTQLVSLVVDFSGCGGGGGAAAVVTIFIFALRLNLYTMPLIHLPIRSRSRLFANCIFPTLH